MKQLILLAALLPLVATATNKPHDPPKPEPISTIHVETHATAGAKASSKSHSSSKSNSTSSAKGGNALATGGKSSAKTGDATSSVGDVSPTQTIGDVSPEQSQSFSSDDDTLVEGSRIPAMFLPMILESGCRTAINAIGENKTGGGGAGVSFMTDRCWSMTSVMNFLAMGEYETACDLLVDVNRDQFKRIGHAPNCHAVAERLLLTDKLKAENKTVFIHETPPSNDFDPNDYVKKSDLAERDKRMAKTLSK